MIKLDDTNFRHRDLNWLSFNERVLQEAEDSEHNPVYERLKFLAIYSTNLDEFFRVRVSQLRQLKRVKKSVRKQLSLHPNKIVKEIKRTVQKQQEHFGDIFRNQIIPELRENHIHLLTAGDYDASQKELAAAHFETHIKEHLEVQVVDLDGDDNIFIENQALYFCVCFEDDKKLGFVNIPSDKINRFVTLAEKDGEHYITFIDDILRSKIDVLFPKENIKAVYEIKMSRDAELYLDDEMDGILADKIYASLKQRHQGQPTRLLYDASMDGADVKRLRKLLNVGKVDMMPGGRYHNFNDFFSFPDPSMNAALHFEEQPTIPHRALEHTNDYFETIKEKDQLVHFPFMTFNYVERFVAQAANDPDVTDIKISLYRVADESPLTTAILKALDNGKKVLIFIEAKARFDEKNNINWGRKFEEKGAQVIYSYPRIKVHSKILLIRRLEDGKKRNYVYIGTGNFNAKTSKIYSDHGLFSANKKIGKELNRVFRVLEGELIVPRNKHLLISPFTTRRTFEKMINDEIDNARQGKRAQIQIKMNSLEDKEMIRLLYKASQEGVKIRMLVRGFTSLIPGVKGLSENIEMTSVLDRYLEHGRIYHFHNDGDEKIYIGSADWMTRNLDRRIEVLVPILDEDCKNELKAILDIQMRDNCKARIQNAEEDNTFVKRETGAPKIRSQYAIFDCSKRTAYLMTTIRVGGVPEHFNLPWHLAIEDGMFKAQGINLEWIEFPEGTGAMNKALRNREIDMAVILTGGVIKDIANGNPSKILQVFVSSPLQWGVHVGAKSNFKSIDELEDATCAISRYGSGSHVMAYVQARQRGWNTAALKFEVVNTIDGAIKALTEGKADYFMWEHFTTKPVVDAGIFRRLGDFPTPWSCFAVAAHDDIIAQFPRELKEILDTVNIVTEDFKNIPSIDRTLAHRYEQKLEDIQKWLGMTTWSQQQISSEEIERIQSRLLDLDMIENKLASKNYKASL